MSKEEFILKLLNEGRAWLTLILPAFLAHRVGLYTEVPVKKDANKQSGE